MPDYTFKHTILPVEHPGMCSLVLCVVLYNTGERVLRTSIPSSPHPTVDHDSQRELRGRLQVRGEARRQQLWPSGGVGDGLGRLHVCRHLLKQPRPLHPAQILQTHPAQVQGFLPAVRQQPGGHRPAGPPHQRLPGALRLQLPQEVGEVRPSQRPLQRLRGVHGVLRPEPPTAGQRHGRGALHRGHPASLPLHNVGHPPHEEAARADVAAGRRGGGAARDAVEALQGPDLQELVLLPHGGAAGLAGCAAASALLHAGAAGPAALLRVQHADELRPAAGPAAAQAPLQRNVLPPGDDLPAPHHHDGVLCVLGSFAGREASK